MLTAPPRDADVPLPSQTPIPHPAGTDEVVLAWTVHLLRGQSTWLPRIGLCLLCVLLGGLVLFHNPLLALLPAAALLFSLSEFLFPIHYTLTRRGAQARHGLMTLEIAWRDVKHAYLASDGIKLSPLARPNSRLEPLRGVFLRFADHQGPLIDTIRRLREGANADA